MTLPSRARKATWPPTNPLRDVDQLRPRNGRGEGGPEIQKRIQDKWLYLDLVMVS